MKMLGLSEKIYHYIWNSLVALSAIFMAVYVPLKLCFKLHHIEGWMVYYYISSVILVLDIVVNYFRLRRLKEITGVTPTTNFWITWSRVGMGIDVVSAIPFGLLTGIGYIQLLRLVKLIRIGQYLKYFRQEEIRYSLWISLFYFFFWITLLAHWLTCIWIMIIGVDPAMNLTTNYVQSVYWVATTLTSVGYGDIVPHTNAEMIYSIFVQIIGVGILGYFVGDVVNILANTDPAGRRYRENTQLLSTTLKKREIPNDLQHKIVDYYAYQRDEKVGYDESAFLESLPDSLRKEVALHLKQDFIEEIPIFKNAGRRFIMDIALKLELTVATPGDRIIHADDLAEEMYFIISGMVNVMNREEEHIIATLQEGDFFGEMALFNDRRRSASVVAVTYCNLYRLDKATFNHVIAKYPDIAKQLEETSKERGRQMEEDKKDMS